MRPNFFWKMLKSNSRHFYNFCPNLNSRQYAYLHVVVLHPTKFHNNATSCLENMFRQTDWQTGWNLYIPSNFVCRGYTCTWNDSLKPSDHIHASTIELKVYKKIWLAKRFFTQFTEQKVITIFTNIIRPRLKYASSKLSLWL